MAAQYKCKVAEGLAGRLRGRVLAMLLLAPALAPLAVAADSGTASAATPLVFESASRQTSLLELYTSQGCYSCPPAENWLNKLLEHPRLWRDVVPVALHVDYWDYLGWTDPYGDSRNQKRHYAYKFQGHTQNIYTPEVILNGRDYGAWRQGKLPPFGQSNTVGKLTVEVAGDRVSVRFDRAAARNTTAPTTPLRAHVALLGFGIEHAVKAGENEGRVLHQEFVALDQNSKEAHPVGSLYHWSFKRPTSSHPRRRSALVAWLDTSSDNRPLQATGGWLEP